MTSLMKPIADRVFSRRLPHAVARRPLGKYYQTLREQDSAVFSRKKAVRVHATTKLEASIHDALRDRDGDTPENQQAANRVRAAVSADDVSPQTWAIEELVETKFADRVENTLGEFTGIQHLPPRASRDRVVTQYLADAAIIRGQLAAVIKLIDVIIAENTRLNSSAVGRQERVPKLDELYADFIRSISVAMRPESIATPQPLTATFLAEHEDDLLHVCKQDVARLRREVALGTLECLTRALAHGVLGVAAWPSKTTACYVRCERQVDFDRETSSVWRWRINKEVHLMDAVTIAGVPTWLKPPAEVQKVIDFVPAILRPHLGTIVGTMTHQRQVSWLVDTTHVPVEEVKPLAEIVPDPAIVIGSVVLTGWERPHHERPRWWERLDCWMARRG